MYLEHFGLNEPPFRITPHTEFFFAGANRGPTLEALIYATLHDEGIVKVSGEVGSGKTMLCRVLMERLPTDSVAIAYLANPSLSRDEILYAIADELHIPLPDQTRPGAALRGLQNGLIKLYAERKRAVVLVDEAHAMPVETLEEIRLLSNLDSNAHKLLQLVLFGQPELNDILARADMRQLKERITHNFELEPLVRNDVAEYLEFRMRAAGYKGPNVFTPAATRQIASASIGLTRRINILADKSLLAAYAKSSHQIDSPEVRSAIRDCDFSDTPGKRSRGGPTQRHIGRWIAITASAFALLGIGVYVGARHGPLPPTPPSTPPAPVVPKATTPASMPTPTPPENPLTSALTQRSTAWLADTPPNRWFLQLFAADADKQSLIETYLQEYNAAGGDPEQLHSYRSDLSGRMRIGITHGDYASREDARRAIVTLPLPIRQRAPYPRQMRQLRKN